MNLRKHGKILGAIYAALGLYALVAVVRDLFRGTLRGPIWLVAYCLLILVLAASAWVLVAGWRRSLALAVPSAVAVAPLFPFGTLLAGYHAVLVCRQEEAREGPRSSVSRALGGLTRLDCFMLVFAAVLLPYAALARDTIGGLNMIAAILSLVIAIVGFSAYAISKKARWTRMVFIYACIALSAVVILAVREMSAGYGP